MHCPYCRTSLEESSPECPSCRLTLDRAASLLGPVPRAGTDIADNAQLLNSRARKKIARTLRRLEWVFPQVRFHVLIHSFPDNHPFELQVFWFFNCGNLFSGAAKAGDNHSLLLAIDPARHRAALIPGYGLEPFLADDALNHLLELAEPSWSGGAWDKGILAVLEGAGRLLAGAALETAEAFGPAARATSPKHGEF